MPMGNLNGLSKTSEQWGLLHASPKGQLGTKQIILLDSKLRTQTPAAFTLASLPSL